MNDNKSFGELFKRFRLKSEFSTLSQFGKVLSEEGLIIEDSVLSRWQNNRRIPQDRNVLLKIISVFIKKGGTFSLEEINLFLESAGQGFITITEQNYLLPLFKEYLLKESNILSQQEDYELIVDSITSWNEKIHFFESQLHILYELIYQGDPFTAYKRLKLLKKLLLNSELKDKKRGIDLLNKIYWITSRCLSDICRPGEFKKGIVEARKNLSFSLEKNTSEVGQVFWVNSALMRLQMLTVPEKNLPKLFLRECFNLAELSLIHTPKSRIEDQLVQHIEIAKIALLIEDKKLFEEHFNSALSIVPSLPSAFSYLRALVWDVRARGYIKFGRDVDSALGSIKIAKSFTEERYQAINLYLGNTELQVLKLSNDPKLLKRANELHYRMDFIVNILDNPYQKLRLSKKKYVGL